MPDAEELSWPAQCRSCGAALHGLYCSACGESHKYERLDVRALAEDALEGLINLDTRVLRTVGDLTVAPATVCRDFLDGRRNPYINPFRYALATFAFAFLVGRVLLLQNGPPADQSLAALAEFQMNWGQALNFAVMPVLAAFLLALFFKAPRKLEWTEHYVLVLFALGHVALFQGLLNPFLPYLGTPGSILQGILPIGYLSWMAVGVYETRWWTTVPRVILAYIGLQAVASGVVWLFVPEVFAAG